MARKMIVVPYDDMWDEMYEKEKEVLLDTFVYLVISIQHFESTAIKGMSAKPIIDIMIIVDVRVQV